MILHNDAVDAILTRRSIRSYQAKQISEDALETILTAGHESAVCKGDCYPEQRTDATVGAAGESSGAG